MYTHAYTHTQVYALQVADTVLVAEQDKNPEVATHSIMKTWDKITYSLNVSGRAALDSLLLIAIGKITYSLNVSGRAVLDSLLLIANDKFKYSLLSN
jgi:hypothetical protein